MANKKHVFEYEDLPQGEEWLTDYYDDDVYTDFEPKDYEYETTDEDLDGIVNSFSFQEIFQDCLRPTLESAFDPLGKLLFWCIVFRIVTQANANGKFN